MGRPRGSKNKPKESGQIEAPAEVATEVIAAEPAVAEEEHKPTAQPAYLQRSALLKEISDSNKERAALEETGEPEPTPEQDAQAATQAAAELEPESETAPVVTAPTKRKFIIDGAEKEFTDEEITAYVQKHATADQRLAEATRLLGDAKRNTAAIPATPGPATPPPARPSSEAGVEDEQTLIKNVTKAVMYGDEEQVTSAFAALLGKGRHASMATQVQGLSPEQIQSYVVETLAFEKGKQLLETPPEQGGYADIITDPKLRGMFQAREDELRNANDRRPYAELYKAIGNEIRQWRDDLIKAHIPKTGLEDRDTAKRSAGVVRGAGGKLPATPMESKPKSHDEILAGMRATRGLN